MQISVEWRAAIDDAQSDKETWIEGVRYARIKYGDDNSFAVRTQCRDCGVEIGQVHVRRCAVEICARCNQQAVTCFCPRDDPDDEDDDQQEMNV